MTSYFHGGVPDLGPGDLILPPDESGSPTTADYGAALVCRRDRVYLGSDVSIAVVYTAMHPSNRGGLYEVEPIGDVEPDPDWAGEPGLSVAAPRARVVAVIDPETAVEGGTIAELRLSLLERFLSKPAHRERVTRAVRQKLPPTPGRNDPCPCGSGTKWKRCCGA